MKRSRVSDSADESQSTSNTPTEEASRSKRRAKASQACDSCRKSKTRCEVLESDEHSGSVRCHRCRVLGNTCSYEQLESPPGLLSRGSSHQAVKASTTPLYSDNVGSSSPRPPGTTPLGFTYCSKNAFHDKMKRDRAKMRSNKPRSLSLDFFSSPLMAGPDWSNAPISAIQEICTTIHRSDALRRSQPTTVLPASSINDILTNEQQQQLLRVFETQYLPWLSLPPTPLPNHGAGTHTPFLDTVKCSVAARHFEPSIRSTVSPRLQKFTENYVARQLFSPNPSIEAVLSLLILSLWSPISNKDNASDDGNISNTISDGRPLAASAVSMAMNMKMDQASETAISLRKEQKEQGELSDDKKTELDTALVKAHLWTALSNTEALLCIGTGRESLARRKTGEDELINITPTDTSESENAIRLALLSQVLTTTEKGLHTTLENLDQFTDWVNESCQVVIHLQRLNRLIQPLPVIAESNVCQFRGLSIVVHLCRILTCYDAMKQTSRLANCLVSSEELRAKLHSSGNTTNCIVGWSLDMLLSAEAMLMETIVSCRMTGSGKLTRIDGQQEQSVFGTAPDRVIFMVTFGALILVGVKFWMADNAGFQLMGASDGLMARTAAIFEEIALDDDHAPAQCARLIRHVTKAWQERLEKGIEKRMCGSSSETEPATATTADTADTGLPSPAQTSTPFPYPSASTPTNHTPNLPSFDYANTQATPILANQDLFMDEDFWASFMSNINAVCGGGAGSTFIP